MNGVEKAKQLVEAKEAILRKRLEEGQDFSQKVEGLERKKAAFEKALAAGDDSQRNLREIRKVQDEIDQHRPRLNGLDQLIQDAEKEVAEAKEDLARIQREKEQRWEIFKTQETAKDSQDLLDSLPGLLKAAEEAYGTLETALGRMEVVWGILESRGSFEGQKRAFDFIQDVPNKLGDYRRAMKLEYLDLPGMALMGLKPSLPALPGVKFTRHHAEHSEKLRLEELRERFEKEEAR